MSPVALLVAQQNVFSFSTRKAGEDPVVGYLAHLVAATYGFNFSLAHLTALHLHDLPGRSILNNWAFPAASIVVHRLFSQHRRRPRRRPSQRRGLDRQDLRLQLA
mmetsp:Transcript_7844/g.26063  ORF Transcript_7844/g.26063 Transcript_7844/m.26063 type:complete len:105 (-) Transcript_7844:945-1259(-)